ncbi:hypothetical protein JB92DRAFT_2839006 [Gautieria morchelliformis]|nr:hypothetical protein JB92DRAFT_2839006 [Gautieria morchelliformis]
MDPGRISASYWFDGLSILIANISVDSIPVILLTRVHAVYNRQKRLLYGMVGFLLIATAATIAIWAVFYTTIGEDLHINILPIISNRLTDIGLHSGDSCTNPSASRNLGVGFALPLANEVVLCLLMVYKLWDRYGNEIASSQLKRLVRDSILVVHLMNLLVVYLAPRGLEVIAIG